MKGALWICERDIRKFLRQPTVMLAAIIGPFLTLILLGFAFGGAITHIPVGVVRESVGPASSNFIDVVRGQQNCAYGGVNCANAFVLMDIPDLDNAQAMLRRGTVKAIIYVLINQSANRTLPPLQFILITQTRLARHQSLGF